MIIPLLQIAQQQMIQSQAQIVQQQTQLILLVA